MVAVVYDGWGKGAVGFRKSLAMESGNGSASSKGDDFSLVSFHLKISKKCGAPARQV